MQREVPDQLTLSTSRNVAKPVDLSLDELSRRTSETKAAPQIHWCCVLNSADGVIIKNLEHFCTYQVSRT